MVIAKLVNYNIEKNKKKDNNKISKNSRIILPKREKITTSFSFSIHYYCTED